MIQQSFPRWNLDPDRIWLLPHLEIIEFLGEIPPERHVHLRIEDLLATPDIYLKQIAEWLEIRTGSRYIDAIQHPEDSPFAGYGPVNAAFGNDPEFLKNPVRAEYLTDRLTCAPSWDPDLIFSEEIKQYARLFGYE